MRSRTKNQSKPNAEVTLMTLLAYDSDSNKKADALLQKYGKPGATSRKDLESKLAQLYFEVPDKIVFEKEMAEIHPHKDWLLKYVSPIAEKVVIETAPIKKSEGCGCGGNCNPDKQSSLDGPIQPKPQSTTPTIQMPTPMDYMGLIGIVAVVGITFYALSKSHK